VETDAMLAFQKKKKSLYAQLAAQNIYVFITRERKGQKKDLDSGESFSSFLSSPREWN
jgi:hypothetical protein